MLLKVQTQQRRIEFHFSCLLEIQSISVISICQHSQILFNNPEPHTEKVVISQRLVHVGNKHQSPCNHWRPGDAAEGCVVRMGVPATLQPDGALRRPAHTGPSLAKPPQGPQSPNCTRPPRWVQTTTTKTHRRGGQEETEQQSGLAWPRHDCHPAIQRVRQATTSLSVTSQSRHH